MPDSWPRRRGAPERSAQCDGRESQSDEPPRGNESVAKAERRLYGGGMGSPQSHSDGRAFPEKGERNSKNNK